MRIIAGDFRGKRLYAPSGNRIRPTSDRVKEAVFSMIGALLPDGEILDLFSGTGNLGLEALSRGAARAVFSDNSRESVDLIRKNIRHCAMELRSDVRNGDYRRILTTLPGKMDVIFLDPPYGKEFYDNCFNLIGQRQVLKPGGVIVAEHDIRDPLPDRMYGFEKIKEKRYGKTGISIFETERLREEDV